MPLWRGQLENVYHTCMRCGTREPLSKMVWQYGLLVCKTLDCVDTAVVGSRDMGVAGQIKINRHELEPDKKLVAPTSPKQDLDILYQG